MKFSIHALLFGAPGLKLVAETCVGNDRQRENAGNEKLATPFLQDLRRAGLVELRGRRRVVRAAARLRTGAPAHAVDRPHAGYVSVMFKSGGEQAVITGGMTCRPCQVARPDWSLGDNDREIAAPTRAQPLR